MTRDEIADLLGELRRARSWLDAVELRAARRVRELEATGRAEPAESLIANSGGRGGRDARDVAERDELCDEVPEIETALAGGAVTAAHVDAIARAAKPLPSEVRGEFTALADELLRTARQMSVDAFDRECRRLAKHLLARSRVGSEVDELATQRAASTVKRWVDRQTGMHHTHLELDAVRDAKLYATVQAELARLRQVDGSGDCDWQQLQVDAFVNTIAGIATPITGGTDIGDVGREGDDTHAHGRVERVPEITALVSYEWLAGLANDGICETADGEPLPISTVRRLCCDAEILPAVLGADGEVLDQGRSRRTANRSQRRALQSMHRGCAFPGCTVGFSACRMHHIRWWWKHRGPTDLDNLLPLCERHHHFVHEGGWSLTMTPDRVATWTRPDGGVHHTGATIDRLTPTGSSRGGSVGSACHDSDADTAVPPAAVDGRDEILCTDTGQGRDGVMRRDLDGRRDEDIHRDIDSVRGRRRDIDAVKFAIN
jgi:hypothetical protein